MLKEFLEVEEKRPLSETRKLLIGKLTSKGKHRGRKSSIHKIKKKVKRQNVLKSSVSTISS